MESTGFSGTQAAKIVGITYRQLDYWARTDLIRPSMIEARGSGSRRQYSYRDLLELRVIKTLLDAGIRLESVRDVFAYLREHVTTDISSANIVISGSSVVLCENDELVDVLRRGQGVLNVLPLAGVKDDIDAQLHPLERDERSERRTGSGRAGHRGSSRRMTLERSPLDASIAASAPGWCPSAAGRCRWSTPGARSTSTSPAAPMRSCSTCRTSARCASTVTDAFDRLQLALTNDLGKIRPGRAQYTHLLDDADGSVLDDIIVWWHPRRMAPRRVRCDAERVEHRPGASRRSAAPRPPTTRAVLAVQGPRAAERLSAVWPEAAAVGRFRVTAATWAGVDVRRRRHRLHRRGRGRDRRAGRRRRADLGRAARRGHRAGRPRCPRHAAARSRAAAARARAGPGHHPAAGRARLGGGVGEGRRSAAAPRCSAERERGVHRHLVGIATEGRRPPRAECAVARSTARWSARSPAATSRRCSATASPSASCRPSVGAGTAGQHRRARHPAGGSRRRDPVRAPADQRISAPNVLRAAACFLARRLLRRRRFLAGALLGRRPRDSHRRRRPGPAGRPVERPVPQWAGSCRGCADRTGHRRTRRSGRAVPAGAASSLIASTKSPRSVGNVVMIGAFRGLGQPGETRRDLLDRPGQALGATRRPSCTVRVDLREHRVDRLLDDR